MAPQAYLNSFCGRFPLAAPNLTTPQVMFKALNQTLPPEWQDAPLPNDPFGISWVYYEAEVVATSPVAALSRDNLNPQSGLPPCFSTTLARSVLPSPEHKMEGMEPRLMITALTGMILEVVYIK